MIADVVAEADTSRRLAGIEAFRLALPLTVPYRLSFGDTVAFDTVLVRTVAEDGAVGWGEATILTGYTDETIDGAWTLAGELADALIGRSLAEARRMIARHEHGFPFAATAFATALDMAQGHPLLAPPSGRVPLLTPINAKGGAALEREIEAGVAAGFRTVKVKVGFEVADDLARVAEIRRLLAGRAVMRIDANQGFSLDDALAFVRGLDPAGIELLEQPCAAADWEAAAAATAAARAAGVPLMLDESIYGVEDIERAARIGAGDVIKLKLMKCGSLDGLVAAILRARELGFGLVAGNGVAADLGCWMEACAAARHVDAAGEMNGFLKLRRPLFREPMRMSDGAIRLEPGYAPAIDEDALAAGTVARLAREF